MKTRWPLLVALVCLAPAALGGQPPSAAPALSTLQKEGRRIFQQKCAFCHLPLTPTDGAPYARRLSKSRVDGREEAVRRAITEGIGPRMPGWKYTLRADQIEALVSYLKTVETPSRTVGAEPSEF